MTRTKKIMTGRHEGLRQVPADAPLLLINIGQLLTLRAKDGSCGPRRGGELSELGIIENGAVLCEGGRIVAVGKTQEALRDRWVKIHKGQVREFDCMGRVVIPGLVDSHTHPVFASPRLIDFEKRISGAGYEEIAEAGGGIRASIEGVRGSTKRALIEDCLRSFGEMLAQGTTTIEAKSGYGLSYESEIKSLEVIRDAAKQWPGTVIATLLGAHVVPPEFRNDRARYLRVVCDMIAHVERQKLASFIDVFVERGAFTREEAKLVFEAARSRGMGIRAHVCQLSAANLDWIFRFDPASLDHMDYVSDEDVERLSRSQTVATLLPGADYFLGGDHYPNARKLIDAGAAVALATDYNPGTSPTPSMPFVMSLACTQMKMSPAEVIAASTINAACALKIAGRKGSVETGKDADMAVFDVRDYREIPYWFAAQKCRMVVVGGTLVGERHLPS